MRRLISLSSMFLTGLALSLMASLSLTFQPWQLWVIAFLIGVVVVCIGWYLDDFVMQLLKVEPITYYGFFFVTILCIILALGINLWLVSVGVVF